MRSCPLLLVLAGLVLAPLTALAFQNAPQSAQDDAINPDRPDFTEGTGIVSRLQVEAGATYSRVEEDRTTAVGEILVRVPLSRRVEARIGVGSYDWINRAGPNTTGYEDPEIGIKVQIAGGSEDKPAGNPLAHPEVALLFLTSVPVGARPLTADAWQPTAKLALGWELTQRFSLSSNVNLADLSDGGRRFSQVAVSLSAGYALTGRLDSFYEVYAFSREAAGGPSTRYADTGLAYTVTGNLKVDVRVGFGFNDAHPDYFVGTGAAFRW
jgi:hypothetical protein